LFENDTKKTAQKKISERREPATIPHEGKGRRLGAWTRRNKEGWKKKKRFIIGWE